MHDPREDAEGLPFEARQRWRLAKAKRLAFSQAGGFLHGF